MNTGANNNGNSVTIALRTSRETKEQLEALAENMGRSTSYLAQEALATYIKETFARECRVIWLSPPGAARGGIGAVLGG
jgi:hypothetical protein